MHRDVKPGNILLDVDAHVTTPPKKKMFAFLLTFVPALDIKMYDICYCLSVSLSRFFRPAKRLSWGRAVKSFNLETQLYCMISIIKF